MSGMFSAMIAHLVLRIAMVASAAFGIAVLWRVDRAWALVCAAMIVYFLVLSAGPEANFLSIRFRAPIIPFESVAAAFGLRMARHTRRQS